MVEPGRGLSLSEKAADVAWRQHAVGQWHLQSNFSAQQSVACANHEAKAARPDLLENLEATKQRLA